MKYIIYARYDMKYVKYDNIYYIKYAKHDVYVKYAQYAIVIL